MLVGTHVLLLLVPGGELKDGGEAHVLLLLVPDVEQCNRWRINLFF